MKLRIATLALLAISTLGITGCNKTASVQTALNIASQVLTLAQDDIPSLQVSGILTSGDAVAFGNWIAGAKALVTQADTCVGASGGTTSVIVGCVNTIGAGLLSPAEQADLRIISAKAQAKVSLYVTAFVLAVNAVAVIVNAPSAPTPTVGVAESTTPTRQELMAFAHRAGVSDAQFERTGY